MRFLWLFFLSGFLAVLSLLAIAAIQVYLQTSKSATEVKMGYPATFYDFESVHGFHGGQPMNFILDFLLFMGIWVMLLFFKRSLIK